MLLIKKIQLDKKKYREFNVKEKDDSCIKFSKALIN
jgi:hypothetical protein